MTLLLTGGSGFLGRHTVAALAKSGATDIVATYLNQPGQGYPGVHWERCDLLDVSATAAMVRDVGASHLLHMAWRPVWGNVPNARDNVDWLKASLDLCAAFIDAGGERLVGAGSCSEYDWSRGPCTEAETPLSPATVYGASKNALRAALEGLTRASGVSFAWARIFFTYGPGEHESRFVASMARALLRGEPAEMTSGQQERDYAYAGDIGEALALLATSDHVGAFNVASGSPAPLREIAFELARQIGRPDLLRMGARAPRAYEPETIVAGLDKTVATLGWRATTTLRAGLAETIETIRAAG